MDIRYRPIDRWPGELTKVRQYSRFDSPWNSTLDLLERELGYLDARDVIFQIALNEEDFRRDGYPRANAKAAHPGVILAFESKFGPLKYATDTFTDWQANVRAIALGLEALRKVDRYGISKRGEQYTGYRALPSPELLAKERGKVLIEQHGSLRAALAATHPDHGGSAEDFHAVQLAR